MYRVNKGTCWPQLAQVDGEVSWKQLTSLGFDRLKALQGLGASQKAEVAWCKEMGYAYEELDVREFRGVSSSA
jgi:hypothetical protein